MVYPGASRIGDSPNKSLRNLPVSQFIIHHAAWVDDAGTSSDEEALWKMFNTANSRDVCPTWQVLGDGRVWECMDPGPYRPWTTGTIDHSAVTCETMNHSGEWDFTEQAVEAVAQLVAWSAQHFGFPIDRQHVRGHREIPGQSTACPGQMPLDYVVQRAQRIASGEFIDATPERVEEIVARRFDPIGKKLDTLASSL